MYKKQEMIQVPVIASFSSDGKIMPLYFRLQDYGSIPVTIKSYVKYITCYQFRCECEIDDRMQEICLIYYWDECKWILTK